MSHQKKGKMRKKKKNEIRNRMRYRRGGAPLEVDGRETRGDAPSISTQNVLTHRHFLRPFSAESSEKTAELLTQTNCFCNKASAIFHTIGNSGT
jgi:hypothetical protein